MAPMRATCAWPSAAGTRCPASAPASMRSSRGSMNFIIFALNFVRLRGLHIVTRHAHFRSCILCLFLCFSENGTVCKRIVLFAIVLSLCCYSIVCYSIGCFQKDSIPFFQSENKRTIKGSNMISLTSHKKKERDQIIPIL